MAPSALIAQLLGALGYPAVATFDAGNQGEVQELVNWLENMKIRQYPEDAREHMRSTDPEAWAAALRKYLVDLECPLALDSASDPAVLRWLLMRAVGEEYRDQETEAQQAVDGALRDAQPLHAWSEQQLPVLADLSDPAVQATLREVLAMLRLDVQQEAEPAEGVSPEALQVAQEVLEAQILPAVADAARHGGGDAPGAAMMRSFPLGFSTGDAQADLAATVLRALYIRDLRDLQTRIDQAIVQVQELTANPVTDASLGKVGR